MSFAISRKSSSAMDKYIHTKLFILFSLVVLAKCEPSTNNSQNTLETSPTKQQPTILNKHLKNIENSVNVKKQSRDMEEFENVFLEYAKDVINRETINIVPGVYIQKKSQNNTVDRSDGKAFENSFLGSLQKFTKTHTLRVDLARATTATGRLFFFKGNWRVLLKISLLYLEDFFH